LSFPALPRSGAGRPVRLSLLAIVALSGCRNVVPAFGDSRANAAANAGDFFSAAAYRFTNVQRDSKFGAARSKLGRYALTPSKIYGDTALWTGRGASDRTLRLRGGYDGRRYTLAATPAPPALRRPADASHTIRLQRLAGDDQFAWTTDVDFAIGGLTAANAADVMGSLLRAAEGQRGPALHADSRRAFPRGSAALGRLFTVDSVRTTPDAAGATTVQLSVSLHPERLQKSFPAFASYVTKYVAPARYRLTLADRAGTRYFTTAAAKNRLTLRARVKDGRLVSFDGPPRPMPDALLLQAEAFAKFGPFTVGASDLVADFSMIRGAHERGWLMRFTKEPDWHLPLAAATFLKSPLRRPFADGGMVFRLAVRDRPGAPTVISRHTVTAVQESAVLRFLGALGSTALSDYAGKSEEEENRFWAEAFQALRSDAGALGAALPAN
jgi:hypothetical protein